VSSTPGTLQRYADAAGHSVDWRVSSQQEEEP
jgi:hypothetical protein